MAEVCCRVYAAAVAVTGIGGLFFRSRDPEARAAWYREHLGIEAVGREAWKQDAGSTLFVLFDADSDYFEAN